MTLHRTGFVLGYHGCDESTAKEVLRGGALQPSAKAHDWLGPGAYFWEGDPRRALEWAQEKVGRGTYNQAAVIGAVIDLGNCLDLTTRDDLDLLATAYATFQRARNTAGLDLPQNTDQGKVGSGNKLLRYLDCAVITHLHENIEGEAAELLAKGVTPTIPPFDTVRGLFVEGEQIYPGGGFYRLTHTQIAVRNDECIKGIFLPRGF